MGAALPVARSDVTPALVSRLLAEQLPKLAGFPVRPVPVPGWDNLTYRLGDDLIVRLPSADAYVPQVQKEQTWLPVLAAHLSVAIPQPVAVGRPSPLFPRPWSVLRWLGGDMLTPAAVPGPVVDGVGAFLRELHLIDAAGGPAPGAHNFHRGAPLDVYDRQTRAAIVQLGDLIDGRAALATWEEAVATRWQRPPVWLHGDVAASNLLITDGQLSGVIDFGCCAVGDPACDLAIGWTSLSHTQREYLGSMLDVDEATWMRGRGWALWKALITAVDIKRGDEDPAPRYGWHGSTDDVLARILT